MVIRITNGSRVLFSGDIDKVVVDTIIKYAGADRGSIQDFKDTIKKVSTYFELTEKDILSKSRLNEFVTARAVSYYKLVISLGHTQQSVATWFNKSHATIINGIKIAKRDHRYAYKNIFGEEIS